MPERRRGAGDRRGDRRRLPRGDRQAALREALAGRLDVAAVARAVEEAGADGLSLVNTIRGLALDARTLRPVLANVTGGLSGPALKPVALAAVHACYGATRLPIVGMGGVSSGRDALELLAAGASAVALGTVLFADPGAPARVRGELHEELVLRGLGDASEVVGIAHDEPLPRRSPLFAQAAGPVEKACIYAEKCPFDRGRGRC